MILTRLNQIFKNVILIYFPRLIKNCLLFLQIIFFKYFIILIVDFDTLPKMKDFYVFMRIYLQYPDENDVIGICP
jgi:hypothetical protein